MAEIVGRDVELAVVDCFFERPRPAALVIDGEPGIGKTILWREVVREAEMRGHRVLSASPTETETQLPFAALGDLLGDAVGEAIDELPQPQRRALGAALLLEEPGETPPDRRAVAVAVLGILRLLAAGMTVLLAIDDVQWLDGDSQSTLEFVFRRLGEVQIGLVLARRSEREDDRLPLALDRASMPVDRHRLRGLSLGALGALVREHRGHSFRRPTLHRIHEISGGNPLFALGLAEALIHTKEDRPEDLSLPGSLREVVQDRIDALPKPTVDALLVAAALAEPMLSALQETVGPMVDVLEPALAARIVEVRGGQVLFTHPLLRSAVYANASPEVRRVLHHRLAGLDLPLEERARHLASASDQPDPATAAVLEDAARSAALRGAPEAAAHLASRAVELSDPSDEDAIRRRRYLAASEYWGAGDVDRARSEIEAIVAAAPPGRIRAEALLRLAKNPRDMLESRQLCDEALAEAADDSGLRCDILIYRSPLEFVTEGVERAHMTVAEALEAAALINDEPKLAHAEAWKAYLDWGAGRPFDRAALDRAAELDRALPEMRLSLEERALYIRAIILSRVGELDEARASWLALQQIALDTGDESAHADILTGLGRVEHLAGNWPKATEYFDAGTELAEQTGLDHVFATSLVDRAMHDAMRGRLDRARADAERALEVVGRTHEPLIAGRAHHALALVAQATGDYAAGSSHSRKALIAAEEMGVRAYVDRPLSTGVEIALDAGDLAAADELTTRLELLASSSGVLQHQAKAERCRGRVLAAQGDLDGALRALHGAVATVERMSVPFERAQSLLALGEAQRRAKQRGAARETLQVALEIFESLGPPLWAARARQEIARIGGRAASPDELTATEQRVAALVAEGKTNKEVAAELVVSVRAVEANLSRIYGKLGVRSRAELARKYRAETTSA